MQKLQQAWGKPVKPLHFYEVLKMYKRLGKSEQHTSGMSQCTVCLFAEIVYEHFL